MKKIAYILFATLILFSCENKSDHEGHEHGDEHSGHESEHHEENEVTITQVQAEDLKIKIGTFSQVNISETIETNGELELAPQNIADVHVLMGGVITKINVIEGSKVKKGQVLAILKHPDIIKLQEDLISKSAELNYLESEYKRQEKLYTEEVGSGKEFQKIKSEYYGAKALVDALKAKVTMLGLSAQQVMSGTIKSYVSIVSPLSGKVSLVETNIGEYVSTDKRLFQVVDNQHLHCAFRIYEKDILKVKEGQLIEVTSPSFGNQVFTATIYAISPAFEENPKSLHIHADFMQHDERLISGMYVTGKIKTDSLTRIVVPRTAIVSEEDKKYVFIHHKDEGSEHRHEGHHHEEHDGEHNHMEENNHQSEIHFKKIEVKTGIEEGDWVEVLNLDDFPKDAEIALTSAYYLQAEIGKGETEHEH